MGKARSVSSIENEGIRSQKQLSAINNQNADNIAGPFQNFVEAQAAIPKALLIEGGIMKGPIAFKDSIEAIVSGKIDVGRTKSGYSSFVVVQAESGTTDDLTDIDNPAFPGQAIYLQADTGDTITIKTSGNISTADGSDFTLNAGKVSPFTFTQLTSKWEQSGGASSGSGTSLGALSDVTITGAAKGDILVYDGAAWVDLTVGTDGFFLKALASETTGLVWASSSATEVPVWTQNHDSDGFNLIIDQDADSALIMSRDASNGADDVLSIALGGLTTALFSFTKATNDGLFSVFEGGGEAIQIGKTTTEGFISSADLLKLQISATDILEISSSAITADQTVTIEKTTTNPLLTMFRNDGTPNDNDSLGLINFSGKDDAANTQVYAQIDGISDDVSSGAEDSSIRLITSENAGLTTIFKVGTTFLEFTNETTNPGGAELRLYSNRASPLDNDILSEITVSGETDTGAKADFAELRFTSADVTNTSKDGGVILRLMTANSLSTVLTINDQSDNQFIVHDFAISSLDVTSGEAGTLQKTSTTFNFNSTDQYDFQVAGTTELFLSASVLDVDAKYIEIESIADPGATAGATIGRIFMDSGNSNHLSIRRNSTAVDLETGGSTPTKIEQLNSKVEVVDAGAGTITTTVDGSGIIITNASSVTLQGSTTLSIPELFAMIATTATGAADGTMWHDSGTGDILCRTGGAEKNLSDIGSGGGASFPLTPVIHDFGSTSAAISIDLDKAVAGDGHSFKITMIGDVTLTFSNPPASGTQQEFEIEFVQDATGGRTVTHPASVVETVTISSTGSSTTIVTYRTNDGGTTYHAIPALRGSINLSGNFLPLAGGVMTGQIDTDGNEILLTADGLSNIGDGGVNGKIRLTVASNNVLELTSTGVNIQSGINLDMGGNDIILDLDGDTQINVTGDDAFQFDIGTKSAVAAWTPSGLTMGTSTGISLSNSDLTQIGNLLLGTSGASTASNPEIFSNGTSMFVNVPSGDSLLFTTNAVNMFQMGNLSSATFGQSAEAIHTLKRIDSTPNDADVVGKLEFQGNNSTGQDDTEYARIEVQSQDVTNATEDGRLSIYLISGGNTIESMRLEPGGNWIYKTGGGDADLQMVADNGGGTGTIATIRLESDNASGTQTEVARIKAEMVTDTAGSEVGGINFQVQTPSGGMAPGIEIVGEGNGLTKIGFHNAASVVRQVVTGARDDPEAALANLLTALANYGLTTDSTTAS